MDINNQYDSRIGKATLGMVNRLDPNSITGLASAPTNSQIRDGVGYLDTQLNELHTLITQVEARLDTVLSPVPLQPTPSTGKQGSAGNGPVSHLFERLGVLSCMVQDAKDRLQALLSRIEV